MESTAEEQTLDYRAHKYEPLINGIEYKKIFEEVLEKNGLPLEVEKYPTIKLMNEYVLLNRLVKLTDWNNIICENMKYNCSNVFIESTSNQINDEDIQKGFEELIDTYNKEYTAVQYHDYMFSEGFNLIDRITPNKPNKIVFPVLEFNDKNIQIVSFVSFYDKEGTSRIRMCCVNINRVSGDTEFYVNGIVGGFTLDHNKRNVPSALSYFKYMRELVSGVFKLNFSKRERVYKLEREKMFYFCSKLNDAMIGDYSKELSKLLIPLISNQIDSIFDKMNAVNNKVKSDEITKNRIKDKLFSTYLGEYITKGHTEMDLKELARSKGTVGYPTKISFKGQELSRGKATARGKKFPLTFETVFYSLNTDISLAGQLEDFTIAWFDEDFFKDSEEFSASQTTIKIKKDYFSIVCNNRKNKNKEMTTFVVKAIRGALK